MDGERAKHRPRKRRRTVSKPASRRYMMMGVGALILLLLIIGIGSALETFSSSPNEQIASSEKSIDLSGSNVTDQASTTTPATDTEQTAGNTQQDVSLPPIPSTPTQDQAPAATEGQQRVGTQGDLNNTLMQLQGWEQVNDVVVNPTLPAELVTVAPMRNGGVMHQTAKTETTGCSVTTRQECKQAVIGPKGKPQTVVRAVPTEPGPTAQAKSTVTATAPTTTTKTPVVAATPKATAKPKATTTALAQTTTPAPTTTAATPIAGEAKSAGSIGVLKSVPLNHYTLQLSSFSNYDNLDGQAKKENLRDYMMYQTTRNSQS